METLNIRQLKSGRTAIYKKGVEITLVPASWEQLIEDIFNGYKAGDLRGTVSSTRENPDNPSEIIFTLTNKDGDLSEIKLNMKDKKFYYLNDTEIDLRNMQTVELYKLPICKDNWTALFVNNVINKKADEYRRSNSRLNKLSDIFYLTSERLEGLEKISRLGIKWNYTLNLTENKITDILKIDKETLKYIKKTNKDYPLEIDSFFQQEEIIEGVKNIELHEFATKEFDKVTARDVLNRTEGRYPYKHVLQKEFVTKNNWKEIVIYCFKTLPEEQGFKRSLSEYFDYLKMVNDMEGRLDKSKMFPSHMASEHDMLIAKYNKYTALKKEERIKEIYGDLNYQFDYKDMHVLQPVAAEDIINEGKALHHCVASYIDHIVKSKGETKILFLRTKEELGKSQVTLELSGNRLINAKGFGNRAINEKEKLCLQKFCKAFKLEYAV